MARGLAEKRAAIRETQRQQALMGETLRSFHERETASPPTMAEIYAANKRDRERCKDTMDMFVEPIGRP